MLRPLDTCCRRWAAAGAWLLAAWLPAASASAAAAPSPPLPGVRDEDLPPPPQGEETAVPEEGTLTPEEEHELRMLEFDEHLAKARIAEQHERFDEAIREYTAALRLQKDDPAALLGRAYSRSARNPEGRCPTRAIQDLLDLGRADPRGQWLDQRQVVVEWMGLCGSKYERKRLALAQDLAAEDPGARGRPDDIRITVAELLAAEAAEAKTPAESSKLKGEALAEIERYRKECKKRGLVPTAAALRLQADLYRESEKLAEAAATYAELAELHPDASESRDAEENREEVQFELDLMKLEATQGWRPTPEAEAAYNRGVEALRRGDHDTAEAELSWAIEDSPWFPRAYHARGVVRARTGRLSPAIDDLKRAIRMDRSDYEAHMTLGLIYMKEFGGAEDDEAIKHLSAALRLRPDLNRINLLLGELQARTDRQKARDHYQAFIRNAPLDDPDARRARKALEDLEREIRKEEPPPIQPPAEAEMRFLEPELQRMINEAYLRGTEHQDWELAEKILLEARDKFPEEPVVLNELARVVYHQERLGDARQYWEASLRMEEEQVEVHERLGLLLRDDLPDEAIPHLRRAAELGSSTARFALAELLWSETQRLSRWEPLEARAQLETYLQEASDYDLHWDRAQELHEEMDRRFFQFYLVAGVILGILVIVPGWRIWRHYRGSSLRQLLERDPKSFPEVARILSLIRHEILKHNTAFLADVGRALEVDAPDAEQRAEVLSRRLFGDSAAADGRGGRGDRRGGGPAGIYGRFLGYIDDLEKVARAHRVTLNLHRKDPIFRPMIVAFEDLARWAPAMRNGHRLRPGKKLELARVLRRSGQVLGRQAFERLSGLIRELCVTNVDAALVEGVYRQVAGEKQFEGVQVAPLQLSGPGAPVRIFRTDLEDILANVLRNSLRSSLQYARPPVRLGVDLITEIDEITGLGTLAIRIKDLSPEQLSNEMLRGRYVERGMGITVDLLSRYDGAIAVEPEPMWSKAVVLRFFILEDEPPSIEAEAAQ